MPSTTILIKYPDESFSQPHEYSESLLWWNTFFKARHEFKAGRIEVLYEPGIKGFDNKKNENVSLRCPHCREKIQFPVHFISQKKGQVSCSSCQGEFGVHPNGTLIVPRKIVIKGKPVKMRKNDILRWVRSQAYANDWFVIERKDGVEVSIELQNQKEFDEAVEDLIEDCLANRLEFNES